MRVFWQWTTGKRTYLLAGALAIATLALLLAGRLSAQTALALLLLAAFGFPAALRAALERHHEESLLLLEELAETGAALAERNLPEAEAMGRAALAHVGELAEECRKEETPQ